MNRHGDTRRWIQGVDQLSNAKSDQFGFGSGFHVCDRLRATLLDSRGVNVIAAIRFRDDVLKPVQDIARLHIDDRECLIV